MLTQTSETAIRTLLWLHLHGADRVLPPRDIALTIGASVTYMSKIARHLVRAGILTAQKGTHGGVMLSRSAASITLLEIVEACQGVILGDYCQEAGEDVLTCRYHEAMRELHEAIVSTLRKWTLADLAERPFPEPGTADGSICRMACVANQLRVTSRESASDRNGRT